jgi:hypothetical protein
MEGRRLSRANSKDAVQVEQGSAAGLSREVTMPLRFRQLSGRFAICRLPPDASMPELVPNASFVSLTQTADELSIVCPMDQVPASAKCEGPWTCFKLQGPFPFSQTGVLASFIDPLAEHGVPIFAIATFDTDYVLVKEEYAPTAQQILKAAGHELIG